MTTPQAFERLGAEVVAINCDWTGDDINVGCGSTDLAPLSELVREGSTSGSPTTATPTACLRWMTHGEAVDGDQIMAICAVRMAAEGRLAGNVVVSTVMANLGFEIAMREQGIGFVKTKVGDRYVLEQMQAMEATLGGEQSGHIIFLDHNTTGDGLVTALQLAATLKRTAGRSLSSSRSWSDTRRCSRTWSWPTRRDWR